MLHMTQVKKNFAQLNKRRKLLRFRLHLDLERHIQVPNVTPENLQW